MSGKLIFYYGTVSSSKTLNLLAIGFNYEKVGWNVCTVKPALDTRSELIETRAHVPPRKADIIISEEDSFYDYKREINSADVILVDECQFLTEEQVNQLRNISNERDIDILCFGLKTDFTAHLFKASKRLFELADDIIEIKTICSICGKHASFNAKVDSIDADGNIIPGWDNFQARCWRHFNDNRE
jgi:thymidine kinase